MTAYVKKDETVDSAYLNFSKAFATVFHSILMFRMVRYRLNKWTRKVSGKWVGQLGLKRYRQWYKFQLATSSSGVNTDVFITFINSLTGGRDYTLSKFEYGTALGGVIDVLEGKAVIQRGSSVHRSELMGALSLAGRSLAMLAGTSRLGSSSSAKALGSQ